MKTNIIKLADKLSNISAYLSGILMILIVILITFEIFLRAFFNTSTLIADEYSAYFFVGVVMLGLAYTLKENSHIRITLISSRLNKKINKYLDLSVTLIAVLICSFLLYHSILMAYDTYSLEMTADTIAETPLYLPQLFLPIGFFVFDLQLISYFIRRLP
ncbi:TRAP transporter small permease [Desulfohalobiaceae bacterium Ax17]|uniref:TRAP transporter small permease subunit n=1 Tax=Desulfovulcanus ferrireducens TaxID=2831190 RepID=UPI00207B9B11|nr:TRAP transporter small permease [Desulfovulcanus ferrireducens]MBT8762433.1 TRAP transporter small permease [Desulfovulcanus ferrireducens]